MALLLCPQCRSDNIGFLQVTPQIYNYTCSSCAFTWVEVDNVVPVYYNQDIVDNNGQLSEVAPPPTPPRTETRPKLRVNTKRKPKPKPKPKPITEDKYEEFDILWKTLNSDDLTDSDKVDDLLREARSRCDKDGDFRLILGRDLADMMLEKAKVITYSLYH